MSCSITSPSVSKKWKVKSGKKTIVKNIFESILVTVLLVSSTALDAASWYQVEVIVFDSLKPDLDGELWFDNPGLPPRDKAVELIFAQPEEHAALTEALPQPAPIPSSPGLVAAAPNQSKLPVIAATPTPVAYQVLPLDRYRLRDDLRNLQLSSAYRPLLHIAWQQLGLGNTRARAVHLEKLAGSEVTPGPVVSLTAAAENTEADFPPPAPVLDGLVRLRSMNVLMLDVDFAYFPQDYARILAVQPGAAGGPSEQLLDSLADYVRLTETKRVLLNELNYFDHPLFGILVQVSRINPDDLVPKPALPETAPDTLGAGQPAEFE